MKQKPFAKAWQPEATVWLVIAVAAVWGLAASVVTPYQGGPGSSSHLVGIGREAEAMQIQTVGLETKSPTGNGDLGQGSAGRI
jgi:hypothetical protein